MTAIERLWEDFELPIKDALHYANGHSYDLALDAAAPTGFTVLAPPSISMKCWKETRRGCLRSMGLSL
ncbi:hypothetical protein GCM10020254_41960 [Streptomyces goshikiensis]